MALSVLLNTVEIPVNGYKETYMKPTMRVILIGFTVTCVLPALASSQPVKVFVLAGQSNMEGQGRVSEGSRATLEMLVKKDDAGTYQHLVDKDANWTVRDDVWIYYNRQSNPVKGGLTIGQGTNSEKIGPELQIGHILGDMLENQVLLIKTCWGGKSLAGDFRPPSSGGQTGKYYRDMLSTVEDVLSHLDTYFPNYKGQGYEIAGFFWWQGWNDACLGRKAVNEYTDNLANLIRDVRAEWKVPDLPVVIATSGNGGNPPTIKDGVFMRIHDDLVPAQRAVAKIPEFKTTVAIAETWDFWRSPKESPADAGHHWNDNAESYFQVGTAMGSSMMKLLSCVSSKAPTRTGAQVE